MAGWNFAELWERIADRFPDAAAQVQGDRRITWSEFDRRADGLARHLLDGGAEQQDKVALYLYNAPEYMEGAYGAFKAGLVPVNTNYRYLDDELAYLWDNADAIAVIFHGCFAESVDAVRGRLPKVRHWLWVDDGSGPCPEWAQRYEDAAATPTERVVAPWGRSGDDILMIYTGGTTGMPKGVMWRQDDLIRAHRRGRAAAGRGPRGRRPGRAGRLPSGPGVPGLPGLPADARHRLVHRQLYLTTGGSWSRWRTATSTSRSCSTRSSARRSVR